MFEEEGKREAFLECLPTRADTDVKEEGMAGGKWFFEKRKERAEQEPGEVRQISTRTGGGEERQIPVRSEGSAGRQVPVQTGGEAPFAEDIVWLKRLLSHNFRMPMAVIAGYGELLQEEGFDTKESERAVIAKICKNIEYMNLMLKVVLDDGNDGAVGRKEEFDLLACIREGTEYVKSIARRQGVAIRVNSTQEVVRLYGSRLKLMRAFFNMTENSLKYMKHEGAICITVDETRDAVYVIYKDDGAGMSVDETAHVTKFSYQGTNHSGGYGIGMYLVEEAVHENGGTLEIRSRENQGMGIYMTFPRAGTEEGGELS